MNALHEAWEAPEDSKTGNSLLSRPGDVVCLRDERDDLLPGCYVVVERAGNLVMVSPVGENEEGYLALCGPPQPVTLFTLMKHMRLMGVRVEGDWDPEH